MQRVYERAADTAKKIRKILKEQFPGVKFSVRSDTYSMGSSVHVSWTDGPLKTDVEEEICWMQSASFDGMTDMETTVGYLWEGERIVGAKYISTSRQVTAERRAVILERLEQTVDEAFQHDGFRLIDWEQAERELIQEGKLSGNAPRKSESMGSELQERETKEKGKRIGIIIPFPGPKKEDIPQLTPEQEFKYYLLEISAPILPGLEERLRKDGKVIDDLFSTVAREIFG
ncbi:LPD29 domain-containing protein [Paenibacillus lautus]|uniref:LPD29 domain-containing protein n=1 Tax=Paenibacillus lautus TaxID=1401 RepID=UPI002DBD38BC|nr:LPD29 domain-containing protein [Paenibacillus lautus]MEC0259354.1 hypothetical protein [Paenibacillus lautus]